jgi:hypothetical protein
MIVYAIQITMLALSPYSAEQDGVRVTADVVGNRYTWTVENIGAEPITYFEVEVFNTFAYEVPEGWEHEKQLTGRLFRARASNQRLAINRGGLGRFGLKINNRGASLGLGCLSLGDESGEHVTFPNTWRPVRESRCSVYVIPLTMCAIALLHFAVIRRRSVLPFHVA